MRLAARAAGPGLVPGPPAWADGGSTLGGKAMISDTLSDAVAEIREYLDHDGPFASCYQGPVRERIERLVEEMDAVRRVLDTPPIVR